MLSRLSALVTVIVLFSTLPSALAQSLQPSIFINAGSSAYFTDFQGHSWVGDEITQYYSPSNKGGSSGAIQGTFEDIIYQTDRWSSDPNGFRYDIPVADGSYEVILHFAEVYLKGQYKGSRVFNVSLEDKVTFPFVDIFNEVGGFKALTKESTTTVRDGVLSIQFTKIIQNPKICGIEIHPIYVPSVLINAGGPSYVDEGGNVWIADSFTNYFNTGTSSLTSATVGNTRNQVLFQTERWLPSDQDVMVYDIPVLNGIYDVYLYFAETYSKAQKVGARVFNVSVEGRMVYDRVDIYQEVGGYTAVALSTAATVNDGVVTIALGRITQNPKICAIEIHPEGRLLTPPGKTLDSIYINVGSSDSIVDSNGITWRFDDFFNTGKASKKPGLSISGTINRGTSDMELYQSNRWDVSDGPELLYNIPASEGDYTVTLHFAETFSKANSAGFRVFNVAIEGDVVFSNVDVFAEVGINAAMTKTTTTTCTDGALTIELQHVTQNPFLSGIEIHPHFLMAPSVQAEFAPVRIDAGSTVSYTDSDNVTWAMDAYYGGGKTLVDGFSREIDGTANDPLYHTERWSNEPFTYEIPLPDGSFKVSLHFAELYSKAQEPGKRIFDVLMEGTTVLDDLDIFEEAGKGSTSLIKEFPVSVTDGALTIEFIPGVQNPKVNAIEVVAIGEIKVHQAHAVPGGPYLATDTDNDGVETVSVDGKFSHTHGPGASLVIYNWKLGSREIGFGEQTELILPIGMHNISLEVRDSAGDVQSDWTIITVRPFGFPDVASTEPTAGDIIGGDLVTIVGQGFNFTAAQTTVHFGEVSVSGAPAVTIVGDTTIQVITPPGIVAGQQELSVETPIGRSNPVSFIYIDGELITYEKHELFLIGEAPTQLAWGPDGRLYVGTQAGGIVRLTLNETTNEVIESETVISRVVSLSEPPYRVILGIAFDPMDTSEYPAVYVAHSFLFHKQELENSYNGKVSKVSGEKLDQMENIITGLPVSDHDHGINGLEFGNDGELYFQVGSNSNAGVPGPMSSRSQLGEGYFSAATLVAYLNRPDFDGDITYDKDGYPVTGLDVEVFASGQRNSFDIVLHSNGNLYATDNGPNFGYGAISTGCDTEASDPKLADTLNHIVKDGYYGHANRIRGALDPRQCIWRNGEAEESDGDFTAPMLVLKSSSNGIIEYESEHFGGQLRGRLIIARYLGELWSVALSEDGRSALTEEVVLSEHGGLDVAMGPDGKLYVAQNGQKRLIYLDPLELPEADLVVKSVFPRRGPQSGGSLLRVHGKNLDRFGPPIVTVGGQNCPVQDVISTRITCTLPPGFGPADIVVTAGGQTSTFTSGYRFITGGLEQTKRVSASLRGVAGISKLVLVDATTEQDVEGGFDCSPACLGSTTFFNIRADTTGEVARVALTLVGPIEHENVAYFPPFSVFGHLNGNYAGIPLLSGSYVITAQALNDEGVPIGPPLSREFTISGIRR